MFPYNYDIIGASVVSPTLAMRTEYCLCICSMQSGNLRNLEVVFRILRILRLRSNLEIAQLLCAIFKLRKLCMHTIVNMEDG